MGIVDNLQYTATASISAVEEQSQRNAALRIANHRHWQQQYASNNSKPLQEAKEMLTAQLERVPLNAMACADDFANAKSSILAIIENASATISAMVPPHPEFTYPVENKQ